MSDPNLKGVELSGRKKKGKHTALAAVLIALFVLAAAAVCLFVFVL